MDKIKGVLNQTNQSLRATMTPQVTLSAGTLNVYTMETGDGREIELCVTNGYICWRRVGDINWIQLVPLSALKGAKPEKGVDYFTQEDIDMLLEDINTSIGNEIPLSSIVGLETALAAKATKQELSAIKQDKFYLHRQDTASDTWQITHNLDKMPSVVVEDSAGNNVIGDITYINNNSLTIKFSGAFSGRAYLN